MTAEVLARPQPPGARARAPRAGARLIVAALLLGACVTSGARPDPLAARFAGADARRARELAPDLHARAERARHDALRSADPAAQADHVLRARLLLLAAIAEADRIELERASSGAEARATLALEQRAELELERRAVEQQIERARAASEARAEATRVLGATSAPPGKPAEIAAARTRDAEFVRGRARLVLAAALGLGLAAERAAEVEQRIAQAERAAPAASLAAAKAVLAEAERALGQARAARSPTSATASAAETRSLLEMAAERGLTALQESAGVTIVLDHVFGVGSAQPTPAGRNRLEKLAALARAHPHGAIQIQALAAAGAGAAAQRLARARAALIERELAGATDRSRIAIINAAASAAADRLQVVFAAYRLAPAPVPNPAI